MPTERRKEADDARKKRSKEALLDAARRVFVDKGYHNTLISDIVADAGFGQGTFYRHFGSKREVFESLLERLTSTLIAEFSDMSAHLPRNVAEYLEASISAIVRMAKILDDNRDITMLFLREAPAIDRGFEAKISTIHQQFGSLAQFYLDHAIEQGFARRCQTAVVVHSLIGMGIQLMDAWFKGTFPNLTREEVVREVVTFAFKGFGLYPEGPGVRS